MPKRRNETMRIKEIPVKESTDGAIHLPKEFLTGKVLKVGDKATLTECECPLEKRGSVFGFSLESVEVAKILLEEDGYDVIIYKED